MGSTKRLRVRNAQACRSQATDANKEIEVRWNCRVAKLQPQDDWPNQRADGFPQTKRNRG